MKINISIVKFAYSCAENNVSTDDTFAEIGTLA